ncbi:hypothetical protein UlMin_016724 [Ulmus minor]
MEKIRNFGILVLFVVLQFCQSCEAKIHVQIANRLGDGQSMRLHCQSKDDDLGVVVLENEQETEWSFGTNFFGTTLFYCDVRWGNLTSWYSFDAYSADRDYSRCKTICRWMISHEGMLFGQNEDLGTWELYSLTRT